MKTGVVAVVGAGTRHKRCARGEKAVAFAPALLTSDGSLRLFSPDHRYQLVLSNGGVGMTGPGGTYLIDSLKAVKLDSSGKVVG